MKKLLFSVIATLSLSQAAFADCWMQCVKNPLGKGCISKIKMCNITDSDRAFDSLSHDLSGAYENLRNEWVNIYGRLPEELTNITDKYPLTLAMLVMPGTREYTLFTMALESYVGKAKSRSNDIKEFLDSGNDWQHKQALDGYTFLFVYEGIDLGNTDWSNPADALVPNRYDAIWDEFVGCLTKAANFQEGNVCLKTLKTSAVSSSVL